MTAPTPRCDRGVAGDFCALPPGHDGACNPTVRIPRPDAPEIPDAAVEAFIRAEHAAWLTTDQDKRRKGTAHFVARAGLAAALPYLLPAAPSGETAPPNLCGHVLPAPTVLSRWSPICCRPAGHDGAHNDRQGAQWMDLPTGDAAATAPEPCGPTAEQEREWLETLDREAARTNAQATPAIPIAAIRAELDAYRDAVGRAVRDPDAELLVRHAVLELVTAVLLAAAPSGEQPTPSEVAYGEAWLAAGARVREERATAQPTTEPAGEEHRG